MEELKITAWNPEIAWILGRPNFWCCGVAEALRNLGHYISCNSESEQAYVIHWLLELYSLHGEDFRKAIEFDLAKAARTPKPWTMNDQLIVDAARHRERKGNAP